MRIVPIPHDSLQPGRPTPFGLRDGRGKLVIRRGATVAGGLDFGGLARRGLWVEAGEADAFIQARAVCRKAAGSALQATHSAYWLDLRRRTNACLRDPRAAGFLATLRALRAELVEQLERDADRVLFALVHLTSVSTEQYSATHALLCTAAATLAARQLPGWTPADCTSIGLAGLSMNVWMTALQDKLAEQSEPPSVAQRVVLSRHAAGAAGLLKELGVDDQNWLEAIEHHHDVVCGPMANRSMSMRMARLLQRADLFTALISPRRSRPAVSAALAAQTTYGGEDGKPDEGGMLMIKALGIFPPGCRVRLAGGELGVVMRRGARANTPMVAVIADGAGVPRRAELLRASTSADNGVRTALAPHEAELQLPFETLLSLGA